MVRLAKWLLFMMMSGFTTAVSVRSINNSSTEKKDVVDSNAKSKRRKDANETCSGSDCEPSSLNLTDCLEPAIKDFPGDFMVQEQRIRGGFIIHLLIIAYSCYAIASVCDDFFIPSLEIISKKLNIRSDVAGATLMAAGTSSPELFESVIGTFITKGDIGVGTIVGSALYNILAVTCFCGLFSGIVVPIDWWPLTRDCLFYIISVVALIIVINDEKVYWFEAVALLILFVFYVLVMYFNGELEKVAHKLLRLIRNQKPQTADSNGKLPDIHEMSTANGKYVVNAESKTSSRSSLSESEAGTAVTMESVTGVNKTEAKANEENNNNQEDDEIWTPLNPPQTCKQRIIWCLVWPINFIFYLTLPNVKSKRWKKFFPLTFFLSIIYLGTYCYIVAWMTCIIGYTFGIPDTVMGISLLAFAISVPEGFSSVIVCRKGFGNMAISNSVGSNAFDILICLGLPWLIKSLMTPQTPYVQIRSGGLVYAIAFLIASILLMYGSIAFCKYTLNKKVGFANMVFYIILLGLACCVELNLFVYVNIPTCES